MAVPKIRFPGFTEDWEQRKFEDIAKRRSDSTISSNSLPCVEYEDVISEQGTLNKDISQKELAKTGIEFESGDVLFGKLRPYLKNWLLPDFNGVAVGDWWVLKPVSTDGNFLYRLIQTSEFMSVANVSSGSKMPRSDWALVSKTYFSIPPDIAEQQKIGAFFRDIDNTITLHQRKLESMKLLKKSLLQKMFPKSGETVPEVRFPGFTDAWEQRKFVDFAQRESTLKLSCSDCPSVEYEDVIAEEGRLNKDIRQKEIQKTGIYFNGSQVLYGKLRPYLHNWLNPDFTGVAVGDWWVLRPSNMDKSFLYRLLQTDQFDAVANQSSGSKMPRADWKLVSNTEFIVPHSEKEQHKIAEFFNSIDDLITLHQRKVEILHKLKKSLLQQMFV